MANDFKPGVGGKVTHDDAKKWIEKYDKERRKEKDKDTKSVFFGKETLRAILETEGAAGISFFLALKPNSHAKKDTETLVMIPTREDGKLIYVSEGAGKDPDGGYVWDEGASCPPLCPDEGG
jgi:hypothetical protein